MTDHARHLRAMKWRGKLDPTFTLPGTAPMALDSAACRRCIEHFFQHGISAHSKQGGTLWALIDYLQRSETPYVLYAVPGVGYEVRKMPDDIVENTKA